MIFELQHEEQTVAFFITKTTKSKAKCLEKKIPGKKRLLESEKYQVNFEKLLSENWCNREIPIKFVIVGGDDELCKFYFFFHSLFRFLPATSVIQYHDLTVVSCILICCFAVSDIRKSCIVEYAKLTGESSSVYQ